MKSVTLLILLFMLIPSALADKPIKPVMSVNKKATSNLKLVIVLIRHGDRTSLHRLPAAPMMWEQHLGQLTGVGMQQTYALGKQLRQALIMNQPVLSQQFDINQIYARALSLDRTLMSAQMFLLGLYPPGVGPVNSPYRIQPIPVFTVPIKHDKLLHASSLCPAYRAYLNQHVFSSKAWLHKEEQYRDKLEKWSKLAGEQITLKTISHLEDPINVALLHHKKIPKGFSKSDLKQILYLYNWVKYQEFKPIEIGRLLGGNLLAKIYNDITQSISGTSKRKFILYSASDTNILSLMSAMGVPLRENPHYASFVKVSVYAYKQNVKIIISYNEHPVKLKQCKAGCSLRDFHSVVIHGTLPDWRSACELDNY